MANPVNFNGYRIAPSFLSGDVLDRFAAAGLNPADYTAPQIGEREEQRALDEIRQQEQDLLRQAEEKAMRPTGYLGFSKAGINAVNPESLAFRQARLDERRLIDSDLVRQARAQSEEENQLANIEAMERQFGIGSSPAAQDVEQEQAMPADVSLASLPSSQEPVVETQKAILTNDMAQEATADDLTNLNRPARARATGDSALDRISADLETGYTRFENQLRQLQEERREEREKLLELREKEMARLNEVQSEDPTAGKSMQTKILSAIAIGLGRLGSTLAGQERNGALEIINEDFRRQQQKQLNKIKAQKGRVADVDNQLARLIEFTGDEQQGLILQQGLWKQRLGDRFKIEAEKARRQEVRDAAMLNAQKMYMDAQESFARIDEMKTKAQKNRWDIFKESQEIGDTSVPEDIRERMVPGMGIARSPELSNKIIEETSAATKAKALLTQLREKTGGFKRFNLIDRAEAESLMAQLTGLLRVPIVGPGAFTDSERAFIADKIIGNTNALLQLNDVTRARMDALEASLDRSINETARAYGVEPFQNEAQRAYNDRLTRQWSESAVGQSDQQPNQQDEFRSKQRQLQSVIENPFATPAEKALARDNLNKMRTLGFQ